MGQKTNPCALRLQVKSEINKSRRKTPLQFGANLHAHKFSKNFQIQLQILKILQEIFSKSGFLLAEFKILQTQTQVNAYFSIYLRKNTAKQEGSEKKETEKNRRLDWTARELVWQELSLNFIKNLSLFFENFLFETKRNSTKKDKAQIQFQPFFQILHADPSTVESLDFQLRSFQRLSFYQDAIQILSIIGNRQTNTGNAELLAKFLSLELFSINQPQILLDFLTNAFSILIPEATSQTSIKKFEASELSTPADEENLKVLEPNFKKISKLCGAKIQIKGALAAFDRATALKFQIGSIPLNKLQAEIDYAFHEAKAKRGLLSIKVWLHYLLFY
jgi:hypothetical protein